MGLLPGATVCSGCGLFLGTTPAAPPPPPAPPVAPPADPTQPVAPPPPPAGKPPRRLELSRQTILIVVAVLVLAAAAIYELHHKSSNNSPASTIPITSQTLGPPTSAPTQPTTGGGALVPQTSDIRIDIEDLGTAEESYLTDNGVYGTNPAALGQEGYRQFHKAGVVSLAGVDKSNGYCLVGSEHGKAPFLLYDSQNQGLQKSTFPSAKTAEQACSDKAIRSFRRIS